MLSGAGSRFLGVPGGTTGQRPTGAEARARYNSSLNVMEFYDGSDWRQVLTDESVTYTALNANGDVGNGAAQVAPGSHVHQVGVDRLAYEPEDNSVTFGSTWQHLISSSNSLASVAAGDYLAWVFIVADVSTDVGELRISNITTSTGLATLPNYSGGGGYFASVAITVPAGNPVLVFNGDAQAMPLS